jgi:diguanylate cyclase (GGDEF)-like protein
MRTEGFEGSEADGVEPDRRLAELLSARELDVLAVLATGATNGEVAHELFISLSRVESLVMRILTKLDVHSRAAAGVRYHRAGELQPNPDEVTPGEGWRLSSDTVADRLARAYSGAIRVGDPSAAASVVDEGLTAGLSAVAVQSRVIAPAMRGIGELWERGGVTVADEHLATAVCHRVLTRLHPGLPCRTRRDGDTVVVAAVQSEHHVLGLRMVADVFEGDGFDVSFLGADVPEDALVAWVREHRPIAVALGVTMPLGAVTLARQMLDLRELDPELQVIVGGQGVPAVLRHGAGVLYMADTEQLAEHLKGSLRTPISGEMPAGIGRGGVGFECLSEVATGGGDLLVERMSQTTPPAADDARGQARRAFVLEQLAFRDPLTELWNRRAFEDRYEVLTTTEDLRAPAILMVDVDYFKSINDDYGHEAGDTALVAIAQRITNALRPGDFAARYGGDEFIVLLPDTSPKAAAEVGDRIRTTVSSAFANPTITVSIGVCSPEDADRRRATLEVEGALYEAKERGRNQLAFA